MLDKIETPLQPNAYSTMSAALRKLSCISSLTALALVISSCGTLPNPEVIPAGRDTYIVSAGGGLGWTTASEPVRKKVYKAANDYCAQRGLVMTPIHVEELAGVPGQHMAGVKLTFRAVPPGDVEDQRPNMRRDPDYILEVRKDEAIRADQRVTVDSSGDLYTELKKLDDLKKDGIITDEEFQTQKKRLLSRQK